MKLSRSEKKFQQRRLHKAMRTIEKYTWANRFGQPIGEQQKCAYFSALYVRADAKKKLGLTQ